VQSEQRRDNNATICDALEAARGQDTRSYRACYYQLRMILTKCLCLISPNTSTHQEEGITPFPDRSKPTDSHSHLKLAIDVEASHVPSTSSRYHGLNAAIRRMFTGPHPKRAHTSRTGPAPWTRLWSVDVMQPCILLAKTLRLNACPPTSPIRPWAAPR
jgi:hypothetical protein